MPVSGLVVTLAPDTPRAEAALAALRTHPCLELGAPADEAARRWPLVVDVPDENANEAVWRWLHELSGVLFVDVVCAYPDPPGSPGAHP